MSSSEKVWQHQIARILISHYDYTFSPLQTSNSKDLIVANFNEVKYPFILITNTLNQLEIEEVGLSLKKHAISLMPNQADTVLGVISLLPIDFVSENVHCFQFTPQYQNTQLLNLFPRLNQIEFKTYEEAETELTKIKEDMRRLVVKKQSNLRTKTLLKRMPVTFTFIGIALVFFLLGTWVMRQQTYETTWIVVTGGMYAPFIQGAHDYWRFLSAGFVHTGFTHLLFNVFSMFNLGMLLERQYTKKQYVSTIIASIIGGNILSYLGNDILSAGLSSGLYGLIGLMIVYLFESQLIRLPAIRMQMVTILLVNLWINFMPNISWLAHLGGLVMGLLMGLAFLKKKELAMLKRNALVAMALVLVGLSYMVVKKPLLSEVYVLTDNDAIRIYRDSPLRFYGDYLDGKMLEYYQQVKGETK